MRIVLAISFSLLAALAARAEDAQPASPTGGVTVNMGALPTEQPKRPLPRHKPSRDDMRALMVPMPRHKPDPASVAAVDETAAAPTQATTAVEAPTLTAPTSALGAVPMPRAKPSAKLAAAKPPKAPKEPQIGTEALPAPPAPVTSPQGAADIASALRGSTIAPPTVDPTAGFAVLTQVRFQSGRAELGAEAKAALDVLAAHLLANEERVRLAAFSGAPGDMSSDARRLSLERALAVRTYLASKGVAVSRIDVLAFGGSMHGASDRVDVLVRST